VRVLYLEDDAADADLARRALRRSDPGIELEVAVTVADAIARLAAGEPPDIVLTDLQLPDGNGLDLLREIRARHAALPVIVLTGQGESEPAIAALRAGADDYLVKRDDYLQRLPRLLASVLTRARDASTLGARVLDVVVALAGDVPGRSLEPLLAAAPHVSFILADGIADALRLIGGGAGAAGAPGAAADVLVLDAEAWSSELLDALRTIRGDRGLDLPVVVVTSRADGDDVAQAMRFGASAYHVRHGGDAPVLAVAIESAYARVELAREQLMQRETADRLSTVVENAMDGIVTIDGDGRIVVFNRAAEAMFGIPRSVALGSPLDLLLPERFWEAHRGHVEKFAAGGVSGREMGASMRLVGRRADGQEFPIEAVISRALHDGEVLLTVFILDITEAERSQSAQRRLEEQLVEARRLEAVGRLAGGIAHDFNNILGVVMGNAELVLLKGELSEAGRKHLESALQAALRGAGLVRQILTFGRQVTEERAPLALSSVIHEAVGQLAVGMPDDVRAFVSCDLDAPAVLANETQLHQVLTNLCTNSRLAIGAGPGRIDVGLRAATLGGDATLVHPDLVPGRYAVITVADNGCGMDATAVERIFEPFYTTRPEGEGTGLGLSVVHGIVRSHGGAIIVESRLGEGTTFAVYLPATDLAPEPTGAAAGGAAPAATASAGGRILLLDDEAPLAAVAGRLLERLGYSVSVHSDAEQALAAVQGDPAAFDLVITDARMPGLTGLEFAAQVGRARADLPVVLMSGFVDDGLVERAAAIGIREVMRKPTPLHELARVVGGLIAVTPPA
jgi:PAS domain S-box-containing protein